LEAKAPRAAITPSVYKILDARSWRRVGTSFMVSPGGVTLPKLSSKPPQESLGTIFIVAGILALISPFISESLGGTSGVKTGRQ
jgi:hypothetical protein